MAVGVTLKVAPSVLKTQSGVVSSEINTLEQAWREMESVIKKTKGYWEGQASNQHLEYYNDVKDDMETIIRRLKEHPVDLLKMAGIYEESENMAQQIASSLPEDVIV